MQDQTFELDDHEQSIARLGDEWGRVVDRQRSKRHQSRQNMITKWEEDIERLTQQYRNLRGQGRWVRGPSDVLSIVGKGRAELYHSAMLAWLLDPLAPHGFGLEFLRLFLNACDPAWGVDESSFFRIQCEIAGKNCRADIVIESNVFIAVIENKVDALEGDHQCDRLYAAFSDHEDARFVFLTPLGRKPLTATGDAREAFRTISYRKVIEMLRVILEDTEGDVQTNGLMTVRNYLNTLERVML